MRYKPLVEKNAISREEYDTAVALEKAAAATVDTTKAQVQQAEIDLSYGFTRAEQFPRVDGYAAAGKSQSSGNGTFPIPPGTNRTQSSYGVGVSAFWELDFFGRIRRATESELAQLYATEQSRRAVVLALVADVARSYIELRESDRLLEISRRTLESRVQYVQLARDLFEGGKTSELDWRQAEAELHRTAALVHEYERLVREKEHELSFLLGRNPGEIPRGQSLDALSVPPSAPAGLPSELLERRPDLREAEELLASSNARIGVAKALLYSRARDKMLEATDTKHAPWYIVRSDDKRRARLNIIAHLLHLIPHKQQKRQKVKLPKRSMKRAYDDKKSLLGRRFVPEKY